MHSLSWGSLQDSCKAPEGLSLCKNPNFEKEKSKYRILRHIYGIEKDGTDEPICRAAVDEDIENRLMDTVGGGEGVGGTSGESSMDTYTAVCKTDS